MPFLDLIHQGTRAEAKGDPDEARALFERAWQTAAGDYERCVAAHFLARHQPTPDDHLRWNLEALRLADAAAATGDAERVRGFYPSLHLNVGYAYESLGARDEARRHYELAAAGLAALPDDPYGAMIRGGIAEGFRRLEGGEDLTQRARKGGERRKEEHVE